MDKNRWIAGRCLIGIESEQRLDRRAEADDNIAITFASGGAPFANPNLGGLLLYGRE